MNNVTKIDIQNHAYYFLDDINNIKNLDSNKSR